MNAWRSQNVPVGEPIGVLVDHRWAGWACGPRNAIRADRFTKSDIQPQSLWPTWAEVRGIDWVTVADSLTTFRLNRSLWPEGIYQPITSFEQPLHERAKGSTGDGCDALD